MDFTTSQTRTERLQLRVVVRPSRPQIIDDGGTVLDLYAGPYRSAKIFSEFKKIFPATQKYPLSLKIFTYLKNICVYL